MTVRLRLNKNLRLRIRGSVTGKDYFFDGAGYELDVDAEDAVMMLEKKPMRACCSGSVGSPYFVLVEV